MNRVILLFFLLIVVQKPVSSKQLSKDAEIVVLTLGPNPNELYAAFGHNAFRVIDPAHNIDRIYNYGVFDYDQPNFYLNFTRGHLNYKLDTASYERFAYVYMYYNRFIHEQTLNLNPSQKQKIFDYLENNMLPVNQYYYYDYFYDNCATKIRDVLVECLGDELTFDESYIKTDYTIRQLTDLYLKPLPWGDLGIDICLGLPMDKKATPYMYMFLPDYIEAAFDHAYLATDSGQAALVKSKVATFTPQSETVVITSLVSPYTLFTFVFIIIIVITYWDYKRKNLSKWLDVILLATTGLLGLLFFLLWVATDHQAAARNMNLLWALPTNLFIIFFLMKKNPPRWLSKYFWIIGAVSVCLLIGWHWMPQLMPTAIYPLVIGLGVRYLVVARKL